jgi:hypothetical protein
MENDDTSRSRRVIIDVQNEQRFGNRVHRRSYKPSQTQNVQRAQVVEDSHVENFHPDDEPIDSHDNDVTNPQVPMELRSLVNAALGYGKRTHALGTLKAVRVLERVAEELRTLIMVGDVYNKERLNSLIETIEHEVSTIKIATEVAYDGF